MEFMILIIVGIALLLLPVFLFFGIVGLAIFIWTWARIGRYFINFGRWLSNWRNFIPLTGCGCLGLIVLLALMALLPQARVLWIILLIINAIIAFICIFFALIAWAVTICRWGWPRYRRWLWRSVEGAYNFVWVRPPAGIEPGPGPRRRPGPPRPPGKPPKRPSMLSSFWALMLGKPPAPARAEVEAEPGPEPTPKPRPVPRPPPKKKKPAAKRSWFSSFWALMLGKPAKPSSPKPPPAKVQTPEQMPGPPPESAVGVTEPEPTVYVTETTVIKETIDKKEKPAKKGMIETVLGGIGRGMAKVGRKIGEGIEWIRIRLNLD